MSPPTLAELQARYGRAWDIIEFCGGWIALRRHFWAATAERYGIVNVLGADTLDLLAPKLEEQAQAVKRRHGGALPVAEAIPEPRLR